MINQHRPAVKFLHSKVRRFAQLSAQTFPSGKRPGYPRLVHYDSIRNYVYDSLVANTIKSNLPTEAKLNEIMRRKREYKLGRGGKKLELTAKTEVCGPPTPLDNQTD